MNMRITMQVDGEVKYQWIKGECERAGSTKTTTSGPFEAIVTCRIIQPTITTPDALKLARSQDRGLCGEP